MVSIIKSSLKIVWKTEKYFFIKQDISLFFKQKNIFFLFLEKYFFQISKNSVASAFFLPRQILKNIDMPRIDPWHLPTAKANFKCWTSFSSGILLPIPNSNNLNSRGGLTKIVLLLSIRALLTKHLCTYFMHNGWMA